MSETTASINCLDSTSDYTPSKFDRTAEYADYKFVRGILIAQDAMPDTVGRANIELEDGSKAIMQDMYNAYHQIKFGYSAFDGKEVSRDLWASFLECACEEGRKLYMTEARERVINDGCYFRYTPAKPHSPIDFDRLPIELAVTDVADKMYRSGDSRSIAYRQVLARDDLPEDPYQFANSEEGIEAARALQEYQEDNEAIKAEDKTPIADYERPHMDGGLSLSSLPIHKYAHLNDNPFQNDKKIAEVLKDMYNLCAEPEQFRKNYAFCPDMVGCASGYGRFEQNDIREVYNGLRRNGTWELQQLVDGGWIASEDGFGANREYEYAKTHWWKKHYGLNSLEAVVRYHFEHIRQVSRPDRWLNDAQELKLNLLSIDFAYCRSPRIIPAPRKFVFDGLHARPVFLQDKGTCIEAWLDGVADTEELLDDNLLCDTVEGRRAYQELIAYQDGGDSGTEDHGPIESWARPQLSRKPKAPVKFTSLVPTQVFTVPFDQAAKAKKKSQHVVGNVSGSPPGLCVPQSKSQENVQRLVALNVSSRAEDSPAAASPAIMTGQQKDFLSALLENLRTQSKVTGNFVAPLGENEDEAMESLKNLCRPKNAQETKLLNIINA